MAEVGISRLPSTPRRHTVEVSASLGPQQAGRIPINAVRAMNSYRQGGPVFGLTHQGSVPLTPSDPIVYAKKLATLCSRPPQMVGISRLPSTPRQHTVEVRASQGPQQAGRIRINALSSVRPIDVRVLSVRPVVCAWYRYNKGTLKATLCSRPPPMVGISRLPGTPRQHTVEVCASPGPQQA